MHYLKTKVLLAFAIIGSAVFGQADFSHFRALEDSAYFELALDQRLRFAPSLKANAVLKDYFRNESRIGYDLRKLGRFEEAENRLITVAEFCSRSYWNLSLEHAHILCELGSVQEVMGKWDEAIINLSEAENIYLQSDSLSKTYLNILGIQGKIHYMSADYIKSLDDHRRKKTVIDAMTQSEMLTEMQSKTELGLAHYYIGSSFWGLDQPDSNKFHYQLALEYWKDPECPLHKRIGYIYDVLGDYAWSEGKRELAQEYFDNAARMHWAENAQLDEADKMQEEGARLSSGGDVQGALKHYRSALKYRVENLGPGNPTTIGCYNYIAKTFAEMSNPDSALQICQVALEAYVPGFKSAHFLDNPDSVGHALNYHFLMDLLVLKFKLLDDVDFEIGSIIQSKVECAELSIGLMDRLRSGERAEESKKFWTQKFLPFFESLLAFYSSDDTQSMIPDYENRVLRIMEKGKAFLLNEALSSDEAMRIIGVPKELQNEERKLRTSLLETQRFLQMEQKKCDLADTARMSLWQKNLEDLTLQYSSMVNRLKKQHPKYYDLQYGTETVQLNELKASLQNDESILEFFEGDSLVYALLINRDHSEFKMIGSAVTIRKRALAVINSLSNIEYALNKPAESFDLFWNDGYSLYEALLLPFEAKLKERIIIIPDGILSYLPFDALPSHELDLKQREYSGLPFLIKKKELLYGLSATLYQKSKSDRRPGASGYLGFAPSYANLKADIRSTPDSNIWNLPRLLHNKQEVAFAKNQMGGAVFMDENASEINFKAFGGNAAILHLAMHTLLDDENPLYSGFIFEPGVDTQEDGFLNTYEIYGMSLNSQLAVLSSCNTGNGKLQRGEGVMSLARGFNYAGCPAMLMSLWECDDLSTQEIVQQFFTELSDDSDKAEALRNAQLAYLESAEGIRQHPYYWAGFSMIGDPRPIKDSSFPWWVIAMIVGLGVIGFSLRSRLMSSVPE